MGRVDLDEHGATEERAAVIRRCQDEWKAIADNDPHLAEQYSTIGSCNRIQKIATARAEEAETGPDEPFVGLWGYSTDRELVLPPGLVTATDAEMRLHDKKSGEAPGLCTPSRTRFGTLPRRASLLQGCHARPKNVCRAHVLCDGDVQRLDWLTHVLSRFVDQSDKDKLESCMVFFSSATKVGMRGKKVLKLVRSGLAWTRFFVWRTIG